MSAHLFFCKECGNQFCSEILPYTGSCGHSLCHLCTKTVNRCPICYDEKGFVTSTPNYMAMELVNTIGSRKDEIALMRMELSDKQKRFRILEQASLHTDWELLTFCKNNGIRTGSESRWFKFKKFFLPGSMEMKQQSQQTLIKLQKKYLDEKTNKELYNLELALATVRLENINMKEKLEEHYQPGTSCRRQI